MRNDVEAALGDAMAMLSGGAEYVPAVLCQAMAYLRLGQKPQARNALKRVKQIAYNPDEADSFEGKRWTLRAIVGCCGLLWVVSVVDIVVGCCG